MLYNLPNNYRRPSASTSFSPAYLRGFEHYYYANLDEPIADTDFANWRLSLFSGATEVDSDIGVITKDVISGADYRFYVSFTIGGGVAAGVYDLVIYNHVTSSVKYISNCITVIGSAQVADYTYLQYRNSSNIFNINYQVNANYQNVFLPINVIDQQPEIEIKQYTEQSTGIIRNQRTMTAKVLTLETYYFDDGGNDMMLALSVHDDILINGAIVTVKTAHSVEANVMNKVQKGSMQVYDQSFSEVNYKN